MSTTPTRTNSEQRQLVERTIEIEQAVREAVKLHPNAVRWTTAPWEKGYPLSLFSDIEVYDEYDVLVYDGDANWFIEGRS